MIFEGIQLKTIVLQFCLYEMGKKINRIFNPREYIEISKEELFEESLALVFANNYLADRIDTTIKNCEGLFKLGRIHDDKLCSLKNILYCWMKSAQEYEDEKEEFLDKYRNLIKADGKFDLPDFILNGEKIQRRLLSLFENFSYKEDEIADVVMNIWRSELTDVSTYLKGAPYKCLVYATALPAERVYEQLFYKPLIYTSLITDKHTKTYQERGYGLIYSPNKESLLYMSKSDNQVVDGSVIVDSLHFSLLNHYMFNGMELIEIQHMDRNGSRTFLPEQLLGDGYNEITLIKNQHAFPRAVFKFSNCTDWEETNATELSKKLDMELITLNR